MILVNWTTALLRGTLLSSERGYSPSSLLELELLLLLLLLLLGLLASLHRSPRATIPRPTSYRSGRASRNPSNHLTAIFGRDTRACRNTCAKLLELQKLCVTATVKSRFKTTCHQPHGTNTVSPASCHTSTGLGYPLASHASVCVSGYTTSNHRTALFTPRGLSASFGTESGGNSAHRLCP